jgi:hypothetical protein
MRDEEQIAFFIRKKPEDAEINIDHLPSHALKKFINPKTGSRAKEWKALQRGIRIHRGADARALRQKYAQRIVPTRYLENGRRWVMTMTTGLATKDIPNRRTPSPGGSSKASMTLLLKSSNDPSQRQRLQTYL